MSKISLTGIQARDSAIQGLEFISKSVRASIGPFGLNILSEKGNRISNDGAFIAQQLLPTINDEFQRRGATVVNENVTKINDEIGDFSSTPWALHEAIVKEAVRYLPKEGSIKAKKTYSEVSQMLEEAKNGVIKELESISKPIASKEELISATLVSVEDEKVAELLGSMQWELGENGRIIAEEVNETECSIEKVEGLVLDNGFTSSGLVTNPEKNSLELNDFPIFLTNYTIGQEELLNLKAPLFTPLINQKKPGVIVMARAFTPDAIKLCQESLTTGFAIIPVNAPYTDQKEVMKDIEAVVGGRYIDTEESSLSDVYITDIGFTKRIVAKAYNAVVTGVEDERSKERVAKRVEVLKKKLIASQSDFEKKSIEERIAQLTGGFAILKVGSRSVTDRKRLKDKCDDAVNTVRLALKGGTVRGAGLALKEISDKMEEGNILKRPLLCIYEQIVSTAPDGWEAPEWVRDSTLSLKKVLELTCAFVPTFISINAIATEKDPKECKCDNKSNE